MNKNSTTSTTPRVLVIAPGHNGRGGIDSVVRLHQSTGLWNETCSMLSTYDDRSSLKKIWAALRAYAISPLAMLGVQIVHFHLAGQISLLRKLPLLVLASAMRKRIIIHVHAGSEESLFRKTPRWAWQTAFNTAHLVIALSPSWAEIIRRNADHAHVIVVPNPVKTYVPAVRNADRPQRILYVGKLEERKGFDTLIAAAAIVLRDFPKVEFWFAGHGDLKTAAAHAAAHGISDNIRLLGWRSAQDMAEIYDQVDLFCLPSHNEGVPMSVLEAMSHELPVICTPVGGIPDVVESGVNGLFVEPGNPHSIADGILHLLREPEFAASLARAGCETVQQTCSLDLVVTHLETIYRDLSAKTIGTPAGVSHGI